MTRFGVIIPSRYASSRLPGKPLLDICGKPMIQRVVENANRSGADFVWVATDDERIVQVVNDLGGEAILTSQQHSTGTDRLAEVVKKRDVPGETIIVNVQGDEPLLAPHFIQLVAKLLEQDRDAGLATLAAAISEVKDLFNPNIVKVVLGCSGRARLFSRAPIPWDRDAFAAGQPAHLPVGVPFLRHIGLYAYRASALTRLSQLPPPAIESAENLEQLRAIEAEIPIVVGVVDEAPAHGVDTQEDLEAVRALAAQG